MRKSRRRKAWAVAVVGCLLAAGSLPAESKALVRLEVASVDAEPADVLALPVRLEATAAEEVVAVQLDLTWDPAGVRLRADDSGHPDCRVDDAVEHFLSAFSYLPANCSAAAGRCSGVRAVVAGLAFASPPAAAVTLFRCSFEVPVTAEPGLYPLRFAATRYSTAAGVEGSVVAGDGIVAVARDRIRTPTPAPAATATGSPRPTAAVRGPDCAGDCDASGTVAVAEIALVLRALFASEGLAACTGSTPETDARVTAAHVVGAIRAHLDGCARRSPSPAPTAPSSPTPPLGATSTPAAPAATATRTSPPAGPASPSPTSGRTPRPSATASRTWARTPSATPSPTRPTRTPTPTPDSGPELTFLGLARADGLLIEASGDAGGVPVYDVAVGMGFHVVLEARPGASLSPVGRVTQRADGAPDIQLWSDRAFGNGDPRRCQGGVPAVPSAAPDETPGAIDALNDLGCRIAATPCVVGSDGTRRFAAPGSTVQHCVLVTGVLRLGRGESTIRARVRDRNGIDSPILGIVVRVAS